MAADSYRIASAMTNKEDRQHPAWSTWPSMSLRSETHARSLVIAAVLARRHSGISRTSRRIVRRNLQSGLRCLSCGETTLPMSLRFRKSYFTIGMLPLRSGQQQIGALTRITRRVAVASLPHSYAANCSARHFSAAESPSLRRIASKRSASGEPRASIIADASAPYMIALRNPMVSNA